MGRSVDYLNNAIGVTFFSVDPTNSNGLINDQDEEGNEIERETNDSDYEFCFDDLLGNITYSLLAKFKSLSKVEKRWDGRETRIILENSHCEIGISEYCSLVSVSIRVKVSDYVNEALAENWIKQNWHAMVKTMTENTYHENLTRIGGFSNGESIYRKTA